MRRRRRVSLKNCFREALARTVEEISRLLIERSVEKRKDVGIGNLQGPPRFNFPGSRQALDVRKQRPV